MSANDQVAQLEAAIKAQEGLRALLGDAVVDATVAALQRQLAELTHGAGRQRDEPPSPARGGREARGARLASSALASLQSHLPEELAAKARAVAWAEGERKQVTLLFADLSGFTALSDNADPEVIRAFQNDVFRELGRIIYQYEGFVEKFVGDAVLAVFGAPVTHEDDAERALRVALAMRERMAELNRRWSESLGAPVTLHVGINTGPVVAGHLGAELDVHNAAYAVTGDTVNTAQRLQDAALPGQILVSRTTYRRTQGAFIFQALEPIVVKNKREPIAVYEPVRARPLPGKLRGVQGLGEVFVGRDDALGQLQAVTDGLDGGGQIVVITGEAGIGKSRLVAEWRKRTVDTARWLEGRCFAHTTTLSYGPILDMLRRFAGIVDDDTDRQARKRLDGALERLFPANVEARAIFANLLAMRLARTEAALLSRIPARDLRDRVFALAEGLCRRLLAERPLIVFFEDMQWVDASTVELIKHLLPLTLDQPLVIAIAARPEQEASTLSGLDRTLASDAYVARVRRISLEPLSERSSHQLVRDLLALAEAPPKLAALISDKAEGNPFFVEEIIRALIERGALVHNEHGWAATPLIDTVTDTIPDTLQGLIMARIDRLPDETKHVVQYAAVIGRTFLYRVLLAIAEHSPSLDADLSDLERRALIRERARQPEVEYTFQHALTQDIAYQSLLKSRSRELHRRVGETMERIFAGRLGEFYAIVADHFRKGEVWDRAADYDLKAGQHASQLFAPEARVHYEQALFALEKQRPTAEVKRQRIEATITLVRELLLGAGAPGRVELDHCLERLRTAESLAESLIPTTRPATADDRLRLARVQAWMVRVLSSQGDYPKVREYLEKLQTLTREQLSTQGEADPELAASIGQVLVRQGDFRGAADWLAPVIGRLEAQERWLEWVHANGSYAFAQAAMGQYRAGLARAEQGVRRSRNLPGEPLLATAINYLHFTRALGGEWDTVHDDVDHRAITSGGHPARVKGVQMAHAYATARLARRQQAQTAAGRPPDRQLDFDEEQALFEEQTQDHHPLMEDWLCAFRAEMALARDDRQAAGRLARVALEVAQARGGIFAEGLAYRVLGELAALDVDCPRFAEYMQKSYDLLDAGGCRLEAARTLAAWGELGERCHDAQARGRLAEGQQILAAALG